jgi:hypothetical protein
LVRESKRMCFKPNRELEFAMNDKAYKRYVEKGPDALTLDDTKAALAFRDKHPQEARAIGRPEIKQARIDFAERLLPGTSVHRR